MENVRDFAVIMFDLERRITFWNAGAERLLEWSEAEIIGQPAENFQ